MRVTPTTDKGLMYATSGPSGSFHVKWHKISEANPIVDRFHVTFEPNSDKLYYLITSGDQVTYVGSGSKSGVIAKSEAERRVGAEYLHEYDKIAKVFLKSVNCISGKLRLKATEAVADEAAFAKAVTDRAAYLKRRGDLRRTYNFTDEKLFTAAGLTKLHGRDLDDKHNDWFEEMLAKLAPSTASSTTETPATTPSSAVFAGKLVPLPPPKGMAVTAGPISDFSPVSSGK